MVLLKAGIQDGILYAYNDPNTYGQLILRIICFSIAVLFFIPLFIIHFRRLYQIYKISYIETNLDANNIYIQDIFPSKNEKSKLGISYYYIWSYHILTILSLIFAIFAIITGILFEMFSIVFIDCKWSMLSVSFSWYLVKICVYIMGILRIFNAFNGSYFDYTTKCRIFLISYLCITIIYTCISLIVFSNGYPITENGKFKWCQYGFNVITIFIGSIFEASMNIILCFLFIRPAIILSKNSENKPEKVLNSVSKVGILMFSSIITSLTFVIVLWFGLSAVLNIDIIVNLYCIILMHKTNEIYYNKLCSLCHNKTYRYCNNYIDKQRSKIKDVSTETQI